MSTLILYFDPALADDCIHVALEGGGTPGTLPEVCILDDLSQQLDSLAPQSIIVVLPGEHILSHRVALPSKASLKALPYLLEEIIANPVEEMHIVHDRVEANATTTATVHQNQLNLYLDKLNEAGVTPQTVIADYQLLPVNNDLMPFCSVGERTFVRCPDGTGFTVQKDQLAVLLPQLQDKHGCEIEEQKIPLQQLLKSSIRLQVLNLLQGAYQQQSTNGHRRWQWIAGYSAAAAFVLTIGFFLGFGWYFNQQAGALRDQAEVVFREVFPNAKSANNIKRRMEGYLKSGAPKSASDNFLELIALSAPLLNSPHQVRHLRFDQKQGELQLEIQSDNNESINQLRLALEEANLSATILSTNKNDAGVLARIKVSKG